MSTVREHHRRLPGLSEIARLVPLLQWLPHYDRSNLRPDILAGIAIWAMAIPQNIAYAQMAGMPLQAGVFVTIVAPLVYAMLGTSRQLMCGPSSATAIISFAHVGLLADGDMQRFITLSGALAAIAGLIFLAMGILRLGFISQFISSSVQVGFLFGLGFTIVVGQMFSAFGIERAEGPFYKQFLHLVQELDRTNFWSLGLALACFFVILLMERRWPAVPSALIVVVTAMLVVSAFDLKHHGVAVMGKIDGRLPEFVVPLVSGQMILQLVPAALAIVLVCYSESMTIARRYSDEHRYGIRADQELVALGAASLASGLFQGFAASGGASQSEANDRNGARTQVSSLILAGLAALTAVVLLPLLSNLPFAALAAVVINAVRGLFNVKAARRLLHIRPTSFGLGLLTFLGVIFGGILDGLVIGVAATLLLLLLDLARPRVAEIAPIEGTDAFGPVTTSTEPIPGLLIVRPEAPLLYLNASSVHEDIKTRLAAANPPPQVLLVDLEATASVDITVLDAMNSLEGELEAMQMDLWFSNLHADVARVMREDGEITGDAPVVFASNTDAVEAFAREKRGGQVT